MLMCLDEKGTMHMCIKINGRFSILLQFVDTYVKMHNICKMEWILVVKVVS